MRTISDCVFEITNKIEVYKMTQYVQDGDIATFFINDYIQIVLTIGENGWDISECRVPLIEGIIEKHKYELDQHPVNA